MNTLVRFGLVALAVMLLVYVINQFYSTGLKPILNDGAVTMNVPEMAGADYDSDTVFAEPIPGSPEAVTGAGITETNWDGLAENQLAGSLSKQYQELNADDLLPHNDSSQWADIYPSGVGQMQQKNFLHAGHHVGINTVGQSLRNPNLQLRSEPANPQIQVSPFVQSTIGPDLLRRTLSINACE